MAEPALPIFHSIDDFLAWEEQQAERYELVGGVLRLMSGGTANHDLVGMNIARCLGNALTGRPCFVHGSSLKVRSPDRALMYPDVFVRCGENRGDAQVVEDPVLVVEVLSPSTQRDDLTLKRWAYQAIPTLQAILLVSAQAAAIELAVREPDGSWRSRHYRGLDAVVPLAALGIELPGAEVYLGVDLGAA
ncbi:MAG: Uma2 family endonuclease [Geminicoccaceae bacterium]